MQNGNGDMYRDVGMNGGGKDGVVMDVDMDMDVDIHVGVDRMDGVDVDVDVNVGMGLDGVDVDMDGEWARTWLVDGGGRPKCTSTR